VLEEVESPGRRSGGGQQHSAAAAYDASFSTNSSSQQIGNTTTTTSSQLTMPGFRRADRCGTGSTSPPGAEGVEVGGGGISISTVLRIYDILVRIRILLFSSLTFKTPTKTS
jgi:hypothetical protein